MRKVKAVSSVTRVVVVDDDERVRIFLQRVLESVQYFSFAGSFSNATEALVGIPKLRPDLALMDLWLPDLDGLECTRRLKLSMPDLKIVVITGNIDAKWVADSLRAGAVGYLIKPMDAGQLCAALRFATASGFPNNSARKTNSRIVRANATGAPGATVPLNGRERQILAGLAEGLLYKEISEKLGISYAAVHKSQHKIFKKLNVTNRSEAIRIWLGLNN